MQEKKWEINKESTDWMRTIAALSLVVIHSLEYSTFPMGPALRLLKKCGFICVSVFLFLSGIGLTLSVEKENYLKNFLPRRFFKLLVPLYIVEFFCVAIGCTTFDFKNIGSALLFWKYVPFSWYVITIAAAYLLFWISNSCLHSYCFFLGSIIGASVLSYLCGVSEMYYKCCPALIVGCVFAWFYQKKRKTFEQHPLRVNLFMWGGKLSIICEQIWKFSNKGKLDFRSYCSIVCFFDVLG